MASICSEVAVATSIGPFLKSYFTDPATIRIGGRIAAASTLMKLVLPDELSPAMP
ncbi:hypothetical protein D3C72_2431530 [compost metagenome]